MDLNDIKQFLLDSQEDELLECLKRSYKIKINEETNEPESLNATIEDITTLNDIIIKAQLSTNELLLKESFRCLRNCSVKNLNMQTKILTYPNILIICKDTLSSDSPIDLKNMILTFLINVCIMNQKNGILVWKTLNFNQLLQNTNITAKVCALVYNIFLFNENNMDLTPDLEFFVNILAILKDEDNVNEFAHFTLDLFIKNGYIFKFYDDIKNVEDRLLILQQLKDLLLKKGVVALSKDNIEILTSQFKKKSDCILKTVANYVDKIEPYEVSLLSDVIASLSSDEKCLKMIQYDRSLLINCAFLLKSIHDAGKEGNNHFAPIGKLSKVEDLKEDIKEHPAFGFRVNMIRILGNLSWKTRCNQDEMRELDVIPLLLDCCNIDGRNPFIIQWVVFAIRNICEKNIENQKVIALMNKQGVVDSSVLNELGITLHDDGPNSINIAPLNLNPQ